MGYFFMVLWVIAGIVGLWHLVLWGVGKIRKREEVAESKNKKIALYSLAGSLAFLIIAVAIMSNEPAVETSSPNNAEKPAESSTPASEKPKTNNSKEKPKQSNNTKEQKPKVDKEEEKVVDDLELIEHKPVAEQYSNYIEGKIKNNTNKTYSYAQISINLLDGDGNLVGSTLDNINNLGPGQTWAFKAYVLQDNVATYQIVEITGF